MPTLRLPAGTKHLTIKPLRDRVGFTFNMENAVANQRDRGMRPGDPPSLNVELWKVKPMRRLGHRDEMDRRVRKTASFSGSNPILHLGIKRRILDLRCARVSGNDLGEALG